MRAGARRRGRGRHRADLRHAPADGAACKPVCERRPAPIQIVNAEAHDPSACGIASNVEYVRGSRIATVRTKDVTWEVVEILVVGVMTPEGARTIAPAVYYSLLRLDERPV